MTLHLHLISHTHWDREWYLTFQQFRLRLVHLMDDLLEMFAADPDYLYFLLDGQTIVLEDYLQIRPEKEEEIRKRVKEGRLLIGPWYILPDEFLVSPEATVRNLLQGERTSRRFGEKMNVGYIPDPFGHISQMPQILRGFGIDTACLQRGLSDEPVELWWQAPDGSRVFLSYLRDGYGNAYALPIHDQQSLSSEIERISSSLLANSQSRMLSANGEGHLLLMQGTDHMLPPPGTPAALAAANPKLEGSIVEHSTLPRYMESTQKAIRENSLSLQTVNGELRSSKRHPLLPGVLSTRMWIKQRNRQCENLLEKWAEPFSVWAELAGKNPPNPDPLEGAFLSRVRVRRPGGLLRQAWKLLMENHPHDSICGCSVDQVHEEMKPRFDQVEQIAEEITRQSLDALARAVNTVHPLQSSHPDQGQAEHAIIVFNPVEGPRTGAVDVEIPLHGGEDDFVIVDESNHLLPHRVIQVSSREVMSMTFDREGMLSALNLIENARLASMAVRQVSFTREEGLVKVRIYLAPIGGPDWQAWNTALDKVHTFLAEPEVEAYEISAVTVPHTSVQFLAPEVPKYGYRTFWLKQRSEEDRLEEVSDTDGPSAISNEFFTLSFSPLDASFSLLDKRTGAGYDRLNRFIDGGDCGDEYNYSPPTADQKIEAAAAGSVHKAVSPVQQSLRAELVLMVPAGLNPTRLARSDSLVPLKISTRAILIPGVPRVEFHTEIDNQALDHRLRVHFPTPFDAQEAEYDGHFEVVRRTIELPEFDSTWIEDPRPEVPQRSFARISGESRSLTLANRGLPEISAERSPSGSIEFALTLIRCVGWLSRDDFSTRRGHAGPMLETPGAQMQGVFSFDYALIPGNADDPLSDYHQAYAFASPLSAVPAAVHEGPLPPAGSMIGISNPAFSISAVKPAEDNENALIVRGYNLTGSPQQVEMSLWRPFQNAMRVNLAEQSSGAPVQADEGRVHFTCGPHEIVTLLFEGLKT
jgi:mannosylglycerate hydrolase